MSRRTPQPRLGGFARHRLDLVAMLFGIVFLSIGAMAVISPSGLPGLDPGAVLTAAAITGGLAVLLSLIPIGTSASRQEPPSPIPTPRPIPTPESVRDEDGEWFGLSSSLSDIEREVWEAAHRDEVNPGPPDAAASGEGDEAHRQQGQ